MLSNTTLFLPFWKDPKILSFKVLATSLPSVHQQWPSVHFHSLLSGVKLHLGRMSPGDPDIESFCYLRHWMAVSYSSLFNFLWNLHIHTAFLSNQTFPFYVPTSPSFHQHLSFTLSDRHHHKYKVIAHCALILILLLFGNTAHLDIHPLVIYLFSLGECLFRSLNHL